MKSRPIAPRPIATRMFSSKINAEKSSLEMSVEWVTEPSDFLQKQIIAISVDAFLDLYSDLTEEQLGLKHGLTKKSWLTNMAQGELKELMDGNRMLAVAYLHDRLAGFVLCTHIKSKLDGFKNAVHIELLAVKPIRDLRTNEKIQVGLGKQLMETVMSRFTDANSFTLDTRLVNKQAIAFYERLGFNSTGRYTFDNLNPDHYTGYQKSIMRCV